MANEIRHLGQVVRLHAQPKIVNVDIKVSTSCFSLKGSQSRIVLLKDSEMLMT